jgi:hypothetical protein
MLNDGRSMVEVIKELQVTETDQIEQIAANGFSRILVSP